MLLVPLFHQISTAKTFEEILYFFAKNYPIILPGDSLSFGKLHLCLSFDDGYFDFYHSIFPLLKKWKIPALLALPTGCLLEKSSKTPEMRLKSSALRENTPSDSLCSWEEVLEMNESGYVAFASHSWNHKNLLAPSVDWEVEIVESKKELEKRIGKKISTFVYPFGKFNQPLHKKVKNHYRYAMRIGSACNFSWQNFHGLTYRIPVDSLSSLKEFLKFSRKISYFYSFLANSLRKR